MGTEANYLINDGFTCKDCVHYVADSENGTCNHPTNGNPIITDDHLKEGVNACIYLDPDSK